MSEQYRYEPANETEADRAAHGNSWVNAEADGRKKKGWFFRKKRKKETSRKLWDLPRMEDAVAPAMERLTNELIDETVGADGVLTKAFQEQIARYDPDVNPISPLEAEELLKGLLNLAVSRRKLLNERLVRCVEVGDLYQSYYGRVQAVNTLAVEAYNAMTVAELAEEDYIYFRGMLPAVRDASIEDHMKPDEDSNRLIQKIWELRDSRNRDIMKALDEFGGG